MYSVSVHVKGDVEDYVYQGTGLTIKEALEKAELALREYPGEMEVVITPV